MIFKQKQEIVDFLVSRVLLLGLIVVSFSGCSYSQNKVISEDLDRVITDTNKSTPKVTSENKNSNVVKSVKENDGFLFKGENINIVESSQSNLEELTLETKKNEFCFQEIDNKIKSKLASFGFEGNTEYFRFVGQEKPDSEQVQFTLKITKQQYANINQELFKKFDFDASVLDFIELYYLKNNEYDYLLLVGHMRATSGIGHYYRHHALFPLDPNKSVIEFDSLSSDPRKVRIDNSGTIYYTKMDSLLLGRVKDEGLDPNSFKEKISLFTFNTTDNKKWEFNYNCKNWE